jgi:BMFP domain-containing protein YqiC|tara:strand:+ start:486 stop:713 length:228 start_codon:yes stop_codon:yes gene_type:complete
MTNEFKLDDLIKDLPHLAESANEEVRNIVKAALGRLIQDMDLVYQEEIDTLKQMLARIEARVTHLENSLEKLERS